MAYRETTGGIIGIFSIRENQLSDLKLSPTPLIIVLEAIEKPGNLGAILRTADAAQVDAVVVCDPTTDIFNPNVIRSSLGCVFSTQVAVCTTTEALAFLNNIRYTPLQQPLPRRFAMQRPIILTQRH